MKYIFLQHMDVGDFTSYICKFDTDYTTSAFILKVDKDSIDTITSDLVVDMKDISYYSDGQAALLFLFKFSENKNLIFGRWFNYLDERDREHLQMLLFQQEISICLVDENNNIKNTLLVDNIFKPAIKTHIKQCSKLKNSNNNFNDYVASLENKYSNLLKLWNNTESLSQLNNK